MKNTTLSKKSEKRISLIPFINDIRNYRMHFFKRDLLSAFSISLLSIPQSIAYSMLAGLPPIAGLFSSIFGTIFTAGLGSSRYLVACPSTGVAILIQTSITQILATYYPSLMGAEKEYMTMSLLTLIVLIIGIIQLLSSFLNLGRLLQFISKSVVLGYLLGVAIAIFAAQLFYVIGAGSEAVGGSVITKLIRVFTYLPRINFAAIFISIISALVLIFLRKKFRKGPNAFIMLFIAAVIAYLFNLWIEGTNIWHFTHLNNLGDMGFTARPKIMFIFPDLNFKLINHVLFSSFAIALLSMLEVFSISRSLAAKSGDDIYSNQEFFAVGVSNVFLSFLNWAMPVSGSLSRSFLNFNNRAKTRFAAVMSGILVAIFIFLGWPLVQHLPLAGLAALLIVIVFSLQDWQQIKLCFFSTRGDAVVFLLTVVSCLIFRLDIAFYIGIAISIASFLRKAADFNLVEYAFDSKGRLSRISPKIKAHREIRIIGIGGEMFFAAVDIFQNAMQAVAEDPAVKVIILRLNGVYHMDASMCLAILGLNEYLKAKNISLLISGIGDEVLYVFKRAKVTSKIGMTHLFTSDETKPQLSTWRACQKAVALIEKS